MPELPEVETARRGIAPSVLGRRLERILVREPRLRWPVSAALPQLAAGQQICDLRRRAKYLIFDLERGSLLLHLGMSGTLRLLPHDIAPVAHDHVDIVLDSGLCLRFNDPRRFGSLLWTAEDPLTHTLLRQLAPEPLDEVFDGAYLTRVAKGRRVAIKQLLMNSRLVVGVGNIYASEALFRAGIRPLRAAGRITHAQFDALAAAIKEVLHEAIRAGGTTLRDFFDPEGLPGYFKQALYVYGRGGEPCRICKKPIRQIVQSGRSTYFCPGCQH
ncbi:formamidopyrimidine-DNA glycosylase [Steroidobacter denitrificans]|uniref:Formamidopyrimidine-DNA glycosylase n=1 Tax=Steroidobacter denitrificans TaxID=465721 RepID=A0A127FCN5_STEDE|nr:bifunctional DNA-formamidopyrimidine glycosylase/DNA-(apurinic or apyrimidinic site) lyase [Steroidobacter denitrificans]AMN48166.1 formamidopyrimidine-DNA glycosylase [Steroidobacter denitrificans]